MPSTAQRHAVGSHYISSLIGMQLFPNWPAFCSWSEARAEKQQPDLVPACVCLGLISTANAFLPACDVIIPLCRMRFGLSLDSVTNCPLCSVLSGKHEDHRDLAQLELQLAPSGPLCPHPSVSSPLPPLAASPTPTAQMAMDPGQPWRTWKLLPKARTELSQ